MTNFRRAAPVLLALAALLVFAAIARQHPFGTYGTETDFYLYYAPDAERLANGEFPESTYHGPGYAAALAAVAPLAGDFFTAGKSISVVAMAAVVLLSFVLFRRLSGYAVGFATAVLVAVSGRLPQYAVSATTDVVFVALLLAAIVALTHEEWDEKWRVVAAGAITGVAWLTRYNAVSLAVAIAIVLLAGFVAKPLRRRLSLVVLFAAAFTVVVMPWLVANALHRGSPFYNTNYLNVAKTLYPETARGYSGDDGLLQAGRVFHSLGDVVRHDAPRGAKQYAANVLAHLRGSVTQSVAGPGVAWLALAGALLASMRHRSKTLTLLLAALATHFAVVGLVHYESRFHFFATVVYSGLAVFAVRILFEWLHERGTMSRRFASLAFVLAVTTLATLALARSTPYVRRMLATHPVEVPAACRFLTVHEVPHARIVARKPHLPYLCKAELVMFPQVRSLDALRVALQRSDADIVFFAAPEAASRPELAMLLDPRNAPPWLRPIWAMKEPPAALYQLAD
jgi:4-amino-4-deoxy-L-arabinose transferase-like glycosyltransferase